MRTPTIALAGALVASLATPAAANWTASGQLLYEHRDWDQTGFTGTSGNRPVRYADVEVIDPTKSGSKSHLAWGRTDQNGAFSVAVVDSSTRSMVRVRIMTQATQTSDLFVKVTNQGGSVYAANSPDATNHGPTTNVDWGSMVAPAFGGGEPFNVYDLGVYGADYVKYLAGSRPSSSKLVTFKWQIDGGVTNSTTSGNTVTLRDNAGYDDTVILHEWSHYVMNNYSKSSNPGGTHYLAACDEDPRLTFDEARASFFGCSVRRYYGWPNANIYLRTDGGSGPGHAQNWYDLEDPVQYFCLGDTSETTNSRTMWDVVDGAGTTDLSIGLDDNPPDALSLPDGEIWQVFTGPIKSVTYVTPESLWDGWFDPTVANGHFPEMQGIWGAYTVEFWQDAYEPNNSSSTATPITANDPPLHLTYFYDSNGDGKGEVDTDYFKFAAVTGQVFTIQTTNLLSANDTNLELLDTNGSTVLKSNNDRAAGDKSSLISWTATKNGNFYIRSKRASGGYTIHGSYDLSLTSP
jgi:Bacterial pre-peptidase C-terminal domain